MPYRPRPPKLSWFWCVLVVAILGASLGIWAAQRSAGARRQSAEQFHGAAKLDAAIQSVLTDEHQLADVLGASRVSLGMAWAKFTAPLMSVPATDSVALVLPVSAGQRSAWSHEHHQAILQAEGKGRFRPAPARRMYWVVDRVAQRPGVRQAQVGTDLRENSLRRAALERAARSAGPQVTDPIRFLDERQSRYGILSFAAIRLHDGQLLGWVATSIQAVFFARQVSEVVPGAQVAVEIGGRFLVNQTRARDGDRTTQTAGGQRWTTYVWAPRPGPSLVPWLLLALAAFAAVVFRWSLRNSRAREAYALGQVELHVSRERQRNAELERQRQTLQERETFLARVFELAPFPKAVLDLEGRAIKVNDAFCELSGLSETDLLQRPLTLTIDPRDRSADSALLAETLAGRRDGYRCEQRMVHRDGSVRHVDASVSLVRDDESTPLYAVLQLRDITEQRRSQEDLSRARRHAEVITQTMAEGYTLTDDGTILSVNDAFCRMLGYSREEMLGMRPPYVFWAPEVRDQSADIRERMILSGGGDFETELVRSSGERFSAEMTARPAYNPDGSLLGLVTTIRDISERRRQEAELERERSALYQAQALAHVGSWDHVSGPVPHRRWSPELWRIAGLEPNGAAPPPGTLMSLVHPEDKPEVDRTIADALAENRPWASEFRIISGHGQIVHVAVSAVAAPGVEGSRSFSRGTVQDITARARRDAEEQALRQIAELVAQAPGSQEVFEEVSRQTRQLFQADSAYVIRFDHDRGQAVCVAGQTDQGERLDGLELPLVVPQGAGESFTLGWRAQASNSDPRVGRGLIERLRDGRITAPIVVGARIWGRLGVTAPQEPRGSELEDRLRRFAALTAMAIANAEASDQLKRQALTDALTGLLNRRAFSARLRREITVAEQTGHPLSLAVIDLDHFKTVNDRHGHQVGDAVLVEFARRLRAAAGGGDTVARLGGEEFAWLMPNLDRQQAREVLCAFSDRSSERSFPEVGVVTMSAGVHSYSSGEGIEGLLREADEAVYRAKFGGRNRVVASEAREAGEAHEGREAHEAYDAAQGAMAHDGPVVPSVLPGAVD